MLPRRGVCLACRASGYGVSASVRRSTRQFSSFKAACGPALGLYNTQPPTFGQPVRSPLHKLSARSPAISQARYNSSRAPLTSDNASQTSELLPTSFTPTSDSLVRASGDQWYFGFLNDELGGFGWGVTSSVQWLFEHLHIWTASPSIGVTVILTAATIRLCTMPLVMKASHTSAQLSRLNPILKPLQEKYSEAQRSGDRQEMTRYMSKMSTLRRENGIKLRRLAYPFGQAILGFGTWRLLRNMADLPLPGMSTGGFLWFSNLAIPDPYCLLPLITSSSQYMSIKLGGEIGTQNVAASKFRNMLMYGLPTASFVFTSFAPAGVTLSFAIASFFSLGTNVLIRDKRFRRRFGLAPIIKPEQPKTPPAPAILDTTGKVVEMGQRQRPLTSTRKVTSFVGNLRPSRMRANFTNWYKEATDSLSGQGGVMENLMPKSKEQRDRDFKKKEDARKDAQQDGIFERAQEARLQQLRENRKNNFRGSKAARREKRRA